MQLLTCIRSYAVVQDVTHFLNTVLKYEATREYVVATAVDLLICWKFRGLVGGGI